MRLRMLFVLLACSLLTVGCGDSANLRQLAIEIPTTATLIRSECVSFGPDETFLFHFTVTDEKLLNRLCGHWQTEANSSPTSSVSKSRPTWWPAEIDLAKMAEKYESFSESENVFVSIWADGNEGDVFVELGYW